MNIIRPYLRVVAGFFAALFTWMAIDGVIQLDIGLAVIGLLLAGGLWYLAVGGPIRDHLARVKAESDALAARAQAGHEAFLTGDTTAAFTLPPKPPARKPVRKGVVAASLVAVTLLLIAILGDTSGGTDEASSESPSSTAVTPEPTTPPVAMPVAPAVQDLNTEQSVAPSTASTSTPVALMPNVTCMNLQAAQDTIQEAGVFYSRSQDATGKGRVQLSDRNWVVVEQNPAPGALIEEGDAMLSVVKSGEPGDCS
ncbi:PASTA domain-containing protein [Rhodococcus marinonascens]|uniref:PASTA domain-containing protein n=1 Tax=Rhodococcus marinonascens TaxID=38311 RepID=UPI000932D067|nr:PASTA domain-containing protein [Rhodococcus marinonascens]